MDKILAFLAKAKSSLTVILLVVSGVLAQIDPVIQWVASIAGTLSPSKTALIMTIIGLVGRARGLIAEVLKGLGQAPQS